MEPISQALMMAKECCISFFVHILPILPSYWDWSSCIWLPLSYNLSPDTNVLMCGWQLWSRINIYIAYISHIITGSESQAQLLQIP